MQKEFGFDWIEQCFIYDSLWVMTQLVSIRISVLVFHTENHCQFSTKYRNLFVMRILNLPLTQNPKWFCYFLCNCITNLTLDKEETSFMYKFIILWSLRFNPRSIRSLKEKSLLRDQDIWEITRYRFMVVPLSHQSFLNHWSYPLTKNQMTEQNGKSFQPNGKIPICTGDSIMSPGSETYQIYQRSQIF